MNHTANVSDVIAVERLDASQPLFVNLRHLATNPQASIDAFGVEWAGMVAASALDALSKEQP